MLGYAPIHPPLWGPWRLTGRPIYPHPHPRPPKNFAPGWGSMFEQAVPLALNWAIRVKCCPELLEARPLRCERVMGSPPQPPTPPQNRCVPEFKAVSATGCCRRTASAVPDPTATANRLRSAVQGPRPKPQRTTLGPTTSAAQVPLMPVCPLCTGAFGSGVFLYGHHAGHFMSRR